MLTEHRGGRTVLKVEGYGVFSAALEAPSDHGNLRILGSRVERLAVMVPG